MSPETLNDPCNEIRELHRLRMCNVKSRIMVANRLTLSVATADGYRASMDKQERERRIKAAQQVISQCGANGSTHPMARLIDGGKAAIFAFDSAATVYERSAVDIVKELPIYAWTQMPAQRGCGPLTIANVVGEAGNLCCYANPGKLWKRMGCAPFEHDGRMRMPSSWRGDKSGFSKEDWTTLGYNPHRRSIAYLIGEAMVKLNKTGPYRTRYDEAKRAAAENHPDWKPLHLHRHAMLLSTKLFLKYLWIEWTDGGQDCTEPAEMEAEAVNA